MPHFSALTWRILAFNALALIVLVGGVILVQATGRGLVEERLNSIQEQANIVAGTIAQYATDPDSHTLRVDEAEPLLRQLIAPTRLRGRLYLPTGRLAIDTRNLLARNVVQTQELPALDTATKVKEWFKRLYDGVMGVRPFASLEPYYEAGNDGRIYEEVSAALTGTADSAERVDDSNRLVLSVAVPIQRRRRYRRHPARRTRHPAAGVHGGATGDAVFVLVPGRHHRRTRQAAGGGGRPGAFRARARRHSQLPRTGR
jgi:two-component system sensor histidine kinase ChvG